MQFSYDSEFGQYGSVYFKVYDFDFKKIQLITGALNAMSNNIVQVSAVHEQFAAIVTLKLLRKPTSIQEIESVIAEIAGVAYDISKDSYIGYKTKLESMILAQDKEVGRLSKRVSIIEESLRHHM